jgi:enediyne biosynthesis protein E4
MLRSLHKRKRQMFFYTAGGALLVLMAGLFVFSRMARETEKYLPGRPVEGITNTLGRSTEIPSLSSEAAVPPGAAKASGTPARPLFFEEVAASSGIRFRHFPADRSSQLPEDMGSGAAWGDFDGDGDDDLYVCNIAGSLIEKSGVREARDSGSNRLYRNEGNGRFVDVTKESGTGLRAFSMAATWVDYDGDTDLDLFVTCYGQNMLYRNDDGKFTDVSALSGLAGIDGFWTGASWGDYDHDGDLDLYVCGYVKYEFDPADTGKTSLQYKAAIPFTLNPSSYRAERNLLYRNSGDGTFTEVAAQAGVDNPNGRSLSAAWCDFDLDGWLDLYVANDISDNAMYRNLGNGQFADISHSAWVADYRGAMGLAIGDWDNDTDFDIYVSHWIAQESAFYNNLIHVFGDTSTRSPSLRFMDISDQIGLGQISLDYICWGTSFMDFDNDGLLDLFVANGSTFEDELNPKLLVPMKNLLFQNRGEEEGFYEVGGLMGEVFSQRRVGRGAAFADFDEDGDMDIFVLNHGSSPFLLKNEGGNNHNWIKVRLQGSKGNRHGLGARVLIRTGRLRQAQQVGAQSSYLSQNSVASLFGIGKAEVIDEIEVVFPGGRSRRLTDVKPNQVLLVREE